MHNAVLVDEVYCTEDFAEDFLDELDLGLILEGGFLGLVYLDLPFVFFEKVF